MPDDAAIPRLVDAITAYIGWVDLVLQAADDETLFRRLRGLHRARHLLLTRLRDVQASPH